MQENRGGNFEHQKNIYKVIQIDTNDIPINGVTHTKLSTDISTIVQYVYVWQHITSNYRQI